MIAFVEKLPSKNASRMVPWLVSVCECTEGNLETLFCLLFSQIFPERMSHKYATVVRPIWLHCGFTVHIKEVYMHIVHSQQLNLPKREVPGL